MMSRPVVGSTGVPLDRRKSNTPLYLPPREGDQNVSEHDQESPASVCERACAGGEAARARR